MCSYISLQTLQQLIFFYLDVNAILPSNLSSLLTLPRYREAEVAVQREQRVRDMARRTHPKSNSDFAVLYNELDTWRKGEVNKIKVSMWVAVFSACFYVFRVFPCLFAQIFWILILFPRLQPLTYSHILIIFAVKHIRLGRAQAGHGGAAAERDEGATGPPEAEAERPTRATGREDAADARADVDAARVAAQQGRGRSGNVYFPVMFCYDIDIQSLFLAWWL